MLAAEADLAKEVQQVPADLGAAGLGERPALAMVLAVQQTRAVEVAVPETLIMVEQAVRESSSLKFRAAVLRLFQRELRSLLQHPVVLIFTP